jgi:hypothetical protein
MTDLSKIKANEIFTLNGHEYRAKSDAAVRNGTVWIDAERRNGAMPSGWELATVCEPHKVADDRAVRNEAANRLMNESTLAANSAERKRNALKEDRTNTRRAQSLGYAEGQAVAYSHADELMRRELRRLMNKFQNGSLTMDDFGIDP